MSVMITLSSVAVGAGRMGAFLTLLSYGIPKLLTDAPPVILLSGPRKFIVKLYDVPEAEWKTFDTFEKATAYARSKIDRISTIFGKLAFAVFLGAIYASSMGSLFAVIYPDSPLVVLLAKVGSLGSESPRY